MLVHVHIERLNHACMFSCRDSDYLRQEVNVKSNMQCHYGIRANRIVDEVIDQWLLIIDHQQFFLALASA